MTTAERDHILATYWQLAKEGFADYLVPTTGEDSPTRWRFFIADDDRRRFDQLPKDADLIDVWMSESGQVEGAIY